MTLTPSERRLRSQIGAHKSWAQTENRSDRTAPARQASWDRFEKLVDPEGILHPSDRAKMAQSARKAHFLRMAQKSAQVRRRRKAVAL
jgi:hypothetical protein